MVWWQHLARKNPKMIERMKLWCVENPTLCKTPDVQVGELK
jgi:hypothetical protein